MEKVIARRPKGNLTAYVDEASSIRMSLNNDIKITTTDTIIYQKESIYIIRKFTDFCENMLNNYNYKRTLRVACVAGGIV